MGRDWCVSGGQFFKVVGYNGGLWRHLLVHAHCCWFALRGEVSKGHRHNMAPSRKAESDLDTSAGHARRRPWKDVCCCRGHVCSEEMQKVETRTAFRYVGAN